ncbi:MAG: MFS transporter, partial [Microbacteriaceae bacterium]
MSEAVLTTTNKKQHTKLALLALALGGFGIGLTEFSAMGLLSQFSKDLLPGLFAIDPEAANAQSGWLISAYALGVVVGAPTIGIFAAKYARKGLLMILVSGFITGTALTMAMPNYELVFVARFLSGLPHGAFFGVAALVAVELMGPERRARGVALVLTGLTVANIIGVPVATWLGQNFHWRVAFVLVFAVFSLTLLSIALWVPRLAGDPNATARNELNAFRKPQVWFALAMGAIGFGGFFAVYSYVDPILTEVTGLDEGWVPIALVIIGIGMTVGNHLGGRLADISIKRAVIASFIFTALA